MKILRIGEIDTTPQNATNETYTHTLIALI